MSQKKTLLELVQDVLSDISGDEVNSIFDTVESEQVANHIKGAYHAIVSNTVWPHTRRALTLIARSDNAFPTHMKVKEELKELISIFYNCAKVGETKRNYKELKYLLPDDFLRKLNSRNSDNTDTDIVVDDSGIELLIKNDKAPEYYTSFNDVDIVFDSYDKEVDSSVQISKVQASGYIIPEFRLEDSFVPDLPVDAFALLREESTSRCQWKMRQIQDIKSEGEAKRQSRWLSQKSWTVRGGIQFPNYGKGSKNAGIQGLQPWSSD